jgi:hypothetical protein
MLTIRYRGEVLADTRADLARDAAVAHFDTCMVEPHCAAASWRLCKSGGTVGTEQQLYEADAWEMGSAAVASALGVDEKDVTLSMD